MEEGKQHRGLFHHHKEEDGIYPVVDDTTPYSSDYLAVDETAPDYEKEEKKHKHDEHLAELGAAAAGAYALHEKHMEKKDPEYANKHKLEEEIAAAGAVGAGGYGFYEHHEEKKDKREDEEAEGKKHHHLF